MTNTNLNLTTEMMTRSEMIEIITHNFHYEIMDDNDLPDMFENATNEELRIFIEHSE